VGDAPELMAFARNDALGVAENGEGHYVQDYMVGVDSHEVDSHVMTCMYTGCSYEAYTDATKEEALEWIKMHHRAHHQQAVIQQHQQALENQ
jgi:hypothetical protein